MTRVFTAADFDAEAAHVEKRARNWSASNEVRNALLTEAARHRQAARQARVLEQMREYLHKAIQNGLTPAHVVEEFDRLMAEETR